MMNQDSQGQGSGGEARGRRAQPKGGPKSEKREKPAERKPRSIPIGTPVSDEELERLKREAERLDESEESGDDTEA